MEVWNEQMIREFSIYKYIMWPVGTWPVNVNNHFATFRAIVTTVLEITMLINLVNELAGSNLENIDVVIDSFGLINCTFLAVLKVTLFRWYRNDLSLIVRSAATDWSTEIKDNHRRIMLNYAELGRFIFFGQMIFSYLTVSAMILTPLTIPDTIYRLNGSQSMENITTWTYTKLLPLGMFCYYDKGNHSLCTALYFLQASQLIATCAGNIGVDIFFYGMAIHICGQFEVLGHKMSQFGKIPCDERKNLNESVSRHCTLLELAGKLENISKLMLLVQLTLNSLHICLTGFQLIGSLRVRNYLLMMRMVVQLTVIMMQIFLYCYVGENLSTKAEEIARNVYLSDWYTLTSETTKDLSFIIVRTTVPFRITAGSFYYMNLNNFKNILKASFSYMSVLQLIFED